MKLTTYKIALGLAALLLLVALGMIFTGNIEGAGPLLIAFFLALAIGFRGYESLKGFVYTTVIFAAVAICLIEISQNLDIDIFL